MENLSNVLGAISHPCRRAIILQLSKGPSRVMEIAAPFELSLNSVSKHLKVLEQAGLIRREVQGRNHLIEFTGKPLREVATWLHFYEKFWNERLDVFEKHFRDKKKGRKP